MKKRIALTLIVLFIAAAGAARAQDTRDIPVGEFKTYTHASKLFAVDLPGNWSVKESTKNGEVILSVIDPTENGAVSIHVWRQSTPLENGPAKYLQNYLQSALGSMSGFTLGDPVIQKDGSTGIVFTYKETVSGKSFGMWGDAFVEQRGDLVGMIVVLLPEEQYRQKKEAFTHLVNSFSIRP